MNKKAAMEMSMGTIVTIVLLMSVLVLGLVMVKNIFSSAKGAMDLTDKELQSSVAEAFSDSSKRITFIPGSGALEIKPGESDAIGLGIKNIADSIDEGTSFSYEVTSFENTCKINDEKANSLIALGKSRDNLKISISESRSTKITLKIPTNMPNCLIRYDVEVSRNGEYYISDEFQLTIKA